MQDIPLHDIKPLADVPDDSLLYLFAIGAALLILALVPLIIWLWKTYAKNKKINMRKIYLEKIHSIDVSNAKKAAYEISEYGRELAVSKREVELLQSLDNRLNQYKYKKEVGKIDDETLGHFHVFLEVLDAS